MGNEYNVIINPIEFFSESMSTVSPSYLEATRMMSDMSKKSLGYLKNLLVSIDNIPRNLADTRIAKSKGNIENFSQFDKIKHGIEFLSKNIPNEAIVKNITTIFNCIKGNKIYYTDGYRKNIKVIQLEYESAVYMLVTAITFAIVNYTDVETKGTTVKIIKKAARDKGVIVKITAGLASELSNKDHRKYLDVLVKEKDNVQISLKTEAVFNESSVSDTIDLIKSIWNGTTSMLRMSRSLIKTVYRSFFGILPLIRSIIYLHYKKKADTILALEEQIKFIELNIEQLQTMKDMDPEKKETIIKKQQAVIEAYKKKSEKLRAELIEGEKEASVEIQKNDTEIKKENDDDFILD